DDSLDDADVDLVRVKDAALLNVKLEVACDVAFAALDLIELRWIAAEKRDALLDRLAAGRDGIELCRRELAAHGAAAVESAFFVLPDCDLDRVARHNALLGQWLPS